MPQQGLIFRALIASPGDCTQERKIIADVIHGWNAVHSFNQEVIIEPVAWETHSRPELGGHPQSLLNKQMVDNCDLLIGAFWTRMGTPTPNAESGTAEEIEELRNKGKPVLLYFSNAPVAPDSVDPEQYEALKTYRNSLKDSGLYASYNSTAEFREQLHSHLAMEMNQLMQKSGNERAVTADSVDSKRAEKAQLATSVSEFENSIRTLQKVWRSEKNSRPQSTDEGKNIIKLVEEQVRYALSLVSESDTQTETLLTTTLTQLRQLESHKSFVDGGKSFREFWRTGDKIFNNITRAIIPSLRES